MTFDKYQQECRRTSNGLDDDLKTVCSALGLNGESGEVADLLKKHYSHHHGLDLSELKYELGDCLWYIADLASRFELDLNDIAEMNIEKLKKRYPDGFSAERSMNRDPE